MMTFAPISCSRDLNPIYRYLCDRRAVWGIVLETLAASGFLFSIALLLGLLIWSMWICVSKRHHRSSIGSIVASMFMFLLATAGIFAITFAFIVRLTPQTCPTRIFLFGVLFSLAFSCLLARCLALLGFAAARGWGEPAVALGLFVVQVIINTEWLILVLVRDNKPCAYSQEEFAMLQIYVLCLLAVALILSYSYTGPTNLQRRAQATLLFLTLLLSAGIWVVWITMLTKGNPELGRRPNWDDPVIGIALVANGWVLLLGYGLSQVAFFLLNRKTSRCAIKHWGLLALQLIMTKSYCKVNENDIDPDKDYSIPRPKATNYSEPYDDYYGHDKTTFSLSDVLHTT
uniref:G protein-coupled receptor class C group 5 member D n=1 Tax=Amphiprion percula TaxID=161767 RepID=A0A3P8T4E2_AMPPE